MKTKTIEEVRKEMIDLIKSMEPEELEKVWNKGFGFKGNYLEFLQGNFYVTDEDWSSSHWDE